MFTHPRFKSSEGFHYYFHEATHIDQEQAKQAAQYYHAQQMAWLEIKKEKMCQKYEIETLKLQVQLAQIQSQQQPQQHPV